MQGRLFTLVTADNEDAIYAWGIEITHLDTREAVIYRRDPDTRAATTGIHASAVTARELYSRMARVPLRLMYQDHDV